ncbi:MAG: UDP-N-acetylmuramoyl-L-alanyl-D-glutamate--2,6-diaminopimelate ligase [Balneolaceae bacterium]|nr:UDP-N-acetylmuramoyl-L-alanyl-D-glutamate--2,6-diaminopimelate ligase [Balneolaceae bacterium]
MKFEEIIEFCNPVSVLGEKPGAIGKLCQDSREVQNGDIFIAVKGLRSDGHNFIHEAVHRGASVIISEQELSPVPGIAILIVKNTRTLLGPLAQKMAGEPAKKLTIIGITGTNGKTTVATLLWQILTKLNFKTSLLGTVEKRVNENVYKSRLTTADPIEIAADMKQMAEAGSEYLVMEVSSHALDQSRVLGIPFDVAVFTNLSHDHLDYHESMAEYASAKKKLFTSLDNKCWAITNADDPKGLWMVDSTPAKMISFSFEDKGLLSAVILSSDASGMTISLDETEFTTPLVGRFNAYNVTEALLICTALGLDGTRVTGILPECNGAAGRMERVNDPERIGQEPMVFVDYAHTPNALENVASTLKELKTRGQRLTIVFGCGGDRDKKKRPEMAKIAEKYGDKIIVTSDNPRTEVPEAIIRDIMTGFSKPEAVQAITSREKAIRTAIKQAGKKSMVLIAGKGHETYQEINGKRIHFDDREIARDALMAINNHPEKEEVN